MKKTDLRQLESRDVLAQISGADNTQADQAVLAIDSELTPPLVLRAQNPSSLIVSIGSLSVQNPLTSGRRTTPPISNLLPAFSGGTVTFPSTSGGNAVPSVGSNLVITVASGQYLKVGINLDALGNIVLRAGTPGASEAAATVPPTLSGAAGAGMVVLHNIGGTIQNITQANIVQFVGGGGSGSGTGLIKVELYDPVSTSLPTGANPVLDSVTVLEDDLVFFTNLSVNNHRVYKATDVSTSVVWTAQGLFESSSETPSSGDAIRIKKGATFGGQIVYLDDSGDFLINDVVRFFDGDKGTTYWELSSLKSADLPDNTPDDLLFSVAATNSENWIINYSIIRGTANRETGQLIVSSNGTIATLTTTNAFMGEPGVTFSAVINGANLEVRYSTTSTGTDASMRFFSSRWADGPGGPGGIPSYPSGGSAIPAAGNVNEIQFKGPTGYLDGDAQFKVNTTDGSLELGGLTVSVLKGPLTLTDGASAATVLSYPKTTKSMVMEYSLERNGETQLGRLLITNNGTVAVLSNDSIGTAALGVTLAATISGANVLLTHTSSSTGFDSTFKYTMRWWQ